MSEDKKKCSCGLDHSNEKEFTGEQMKEVAELVYSTVKMIAEGVHMGPIHMASILSLLTARICDVNDVDRINMVRVMLETPGDGQCALELHEVRRKPNKLADNDPAKQWN